MEKLLKYVAEEINNVGCFQSTCYINQYNLLIYIIAKN